MLTMTAMGLAASVLSIAACTHTTDRIVEPVGAGDASAPSPAVEDGGLNPLTPIARPPEPLEDYRLVRAPEFGLAREISYRPDDEQVPGVGGSAGMPGAAGTAGFERRPVATGGGYF